MLLTCSFVKWLLPFLLLMISLEVTLAVLPPECTFEGVRVAEKYNKPHLGADCITTDKKKAEKKWKRTSDYSYGGLDDFCLHTQISDKAGMIASRKRQYRGIGQDFKIIQKLQRGNAWSFQRDGPLETANMDWNFPQKQFLQFVQRAERYYELARRYKINITMWKEIETIYKGHKLDVNNTEFNKTLFDWIDLDREMFTGNSYLPGPAYTGIYPQLLDESNKQQNIVGAHGSKSTWLDVMGYLDEFHYMNFGETRTWLKAGYSLDRYGRTGEKLYTEQGLKKNFAIGEGDFRPFRTHPTIAPVYTALRNYKMLRYEIDGLREVNYGFSEDSKKRRKEIVESCEEHGQAYRHHYFQLEHLIKNIENSPFTADYLAPNPYFVEASAIMVNHELLKNFLHIRVFMNRSVSDFRPNLHTGKERSDNAKGRMKAVIIIVKDQEGFPVGSFSRPVPCDRTCNEYSAPVKKHNTYRNDLPCVFTPPTSNEHPGIFVWPGSDETSEETDFEGMREVHATWSFAQDSCNFVTELHIQTLVLEDVELELPGTDRLKVCSNLNTQPSCTKKGPNPCKVELKCLNPVDLAPGLDRGIRDGVKHFTECDTVQKVLHLENWLLHNCPDIGRGHLFGWTARYNIIHPALFSVGAPDYVNVEELRDLERRGAHIDCHVPLKIEHGFTVGNVPKNMKAIPSMAPYFLELMSEFALEQQDLDILYYGTHYNGRLQCREPKLNPGASAEAIEELKKTLAPPPVKQFMETPGIRCPCPALGTTIDPNSESATVDPARLHGRLLHASHMTLAWMLLVPLSIVVCRFYKETFSLVFCVQEYWWFAWHVGLLFAAAVFTMGGILAVSARKSTHLKLTDEMLVHQVFGAFSIILFYIQIVTGFFRSKDPQKRMRQIFVHWILGMVNQTSAILAVIVMGFIKETGMSCNALYTSFAWFIFYATVFGILETYMRLKDRALNLDPPRSYLPPPMKRLFGRDAPGRNFRIVVLGVFIIGMIIFYLLMSYYIWTSDGVSCFDETEKTSSKEGAQEPTSGEGEYYEA